MEQDEDEFQRLTEATAAGDRASLEELLEKLLPDLRAFVRLRAGRLVRLRESDSDVVQSVCREILTHADRFEHPSQGAFKRWLFTTALRKLSERRDHHLAAKRDVLRTEGDDTGLASAYARVATPSQHASVREELERVELAMNALAEEDRSLIVLSRIVGLSHDELAKDAGVAPGALRMRLHRALARLAILLEEEPDTDQH